MSLQLRHCPKCGALQADIPECSACGAALGGRGGRATGDDISGREILRLAGVLIAVLGGFVAFVIAVLSAITWLLQ